MAGKARRRRESLSVEVVSSLEEGRALADAWAPLAEAAGTGPAMLPSLALAWWEHLGRGELALVVVRDGDEVLAVAPLHRRRTLGRTWWRWLGHGTGVVGEVVASPQDPRDATGALWAHLEQLDGAVHLLEMAAHGAGLLALRRAADWGVDLRVRDLCPVVDTVAYGSTPRFLADRRNLRHLLGKAERRAGARGGWSVRTATSPAELEDVLPEVIAVYDAAEAVHPRWHVLGGATASFGHSALIDAARQGHLVLLIGSVGGEPAAFDLWFRVGNRQSAWIGRIDPRFVECAPGHLLLRAGIEHAVAVGVEVVDLQLGDSEYKRRWATSTYDTYEVVAAPTSRFRSTRAAAAALGALSPARQALRGARARRVR